MVTDKNYYQKVGKRLIVFILTLISLYTLNFSIKNPPLTVGYFTTN